MGTPDARKSQLERFKVEVKTIFADDDAERFEEQLKKIVSVKPDEKKSDSD